MKLKTDFLRSSLIQKLIFSIGLMIVIFSADTIFAQSNITLNQLSCNHFENAIGVLDKPVFGWKLNASQNNQSQTAYQIVVSSSIKNNLASIGDVWDSKKIISSSQINIPFYERTLTSSKSYFWKVKIWDQSGKSSSWSKSSQFITGLINKEDFKGEWITSNKQKEHAAPLFRKSFTLSTIPQNAIIHIAGLGYYELYVNGKKVGDHVLDPGQTNYEDYAFYVTYNIASLLKKGENVIGVMLGDGFYNQDQVFLNLGTYGKPLFWTQLDMLVAGEKQQIVSDLSWKWNDGPIQSNNVYAGEVYDANKEIKGWASAGLATPYWKTVYLAKKYPPKVKPQNLQPIKKMGEIRPKNFYKTDRGSYMFDMGQNFAGWNRLKVTAPKGTEIKMVMAEDLLKDGNLNHFSTGINATKVEQTEKYIAKGTGIEIWEPRFTYHGFRYVEVSGLTSPPTPYLLTGIIVYSSVSSAGSFSCSDDQINKLHQLSKWTLTSNLHSIPTDCPHREKCGWLGDSHAIAPFSIYNLDVQNFWLKFVDDIHSTGRLGMDSQFHIEKNKIYTKGFKEAGIPMMVSPGKRSIAVASPDWGSALVQLPWYLYTYYGNVEVIKKQYPEMKQWVNYVATLAKDRVIYGGLGDWCPPRTNLKMDCDPKISSTALYYNDLTITKNAAGILNLKADSIVFADSAALIKKSFIAKFFDVKTNSFGSHTADALALNYGLFPDGKGVLVANALSKSSKEKYDGFMNSGFLGLQRLFGGLSNYNNEKMAYDILTKKGEFSFEMMWKHYDATTLWEILPVYTDSLMEKTLESGSQNHPFQGGFDAFFFEGIGGIKPDVNAPGFKNIILEPKLINQLKWAKADYNSVYGKIVSSWKREGETLIWNVTIPVNATAELKLPNQFTKITIKDGMGKTLVQNESNPNRKLTSGKYQLIIQ